MVVKPYIYALPNTARPPAAHTDRVVRDTFVPFVPMYLNNVFLYRYHVFRLRRVELKIESRLILDSGGDGAQS